MALYSWALYVAWGRGKVVAPERKPPRLQTEIRRVR